MSKNTLYYLLALCCFLAAANAQDDNSAKTSEGTANRAKVVESANISSLYIGDLLRTKPSKQEEVLEASDSLHLPILLDQQRFHASGAGVRGVHYKTHGGHEYGETRGQSVPQGRATPPLVGHLLTLKPVRVFKADASPALSRSPGEAYPKSGSDEHYEGDDCSKSGEHSSTYSDEPEQRTYRRAKQVAAPPEVVEYRSPPGYANDEPPPQIYSHSDPSSYDSKSYPSSSKSYGSGSKSYPSDSKSYASDTESYPSDTKSHSSGSYTRSKSTSSSKSSAPSRDKPAAVIVPSPLSHSDHPSSPGHGGSRPGSSPEYVVYKVKEPKGGERPGYAREGGSPSDYPPPSAGYSEAEPPHHHKSGREESPYSQYPPSKKSRKLNQGIRKQYATTSEEQQYGPAPSHYGQGTDGYSQQAGTYPPGEQNRYREQQQHGPSGSYYHPQQQEGYGQQPEPEGQYQRKPQQYYKATESSAPYESEMPGKSRSKKHRGGYERPVSEGKEPSRYRGGEPTGTEYSYPPAAQPSRSKKEDVLQSGYQGYNSRDVHSESSTSPYDRQQQHSRPAEDKRSQHRYPQYQSDVRQPEEHNQQHPKRRYRESSRPVRSSEKRMRPEGPAAQLSGTSHKPVVMFTRDGKFSESFSENLHDAAQKPFDFGELFRATRQMENPEYQTSYKPYNSEYPASYANDQHHYNNAQEEEQRPSQSHDRPRYGPSQSQTQSYSGGGGGPAGPGYQSSYEGDEDEDDSREKAPVKKSKDHHYISKIEGYKDTYGSHEPLTIDEEFFKKYGISPTAKVIVASVKKPNLFVADGTGIKEGEYFGGHSGHPGSHSGQGQGGGYDGPGSSGPPSYEGGPGPYESEGPENSGHPREEDDRSYEPDFKSQSYKEEDSREELGPPKQIPGSFDDLVGTNPKFLRHLPRILRGEEAVFKMDSTEESYEGVEYPKEERKKKKSFVVSQGPRGIVQQHGDGVSRIMFNMPVPASQDASDQEESIESRSAKEETDRIVSAASEVIADLIASDS